MKKRNNKLITIGKNPYRNLFAGGSVMDIFGGNSGTALGNNLGSGWQNYNDTYANYTPWDQNSSFYQKPSTRNFTQQSPTGSNDLPKSLSNTNVGNGLGVASTALELASSGINNLKAPDASDLYDPITAMTKTGLSEEANQDIRSAGRINVAENAATGALKGATAGLAFGPWGAVIGGVIGGGWGTATSIIGNNKRESAEQEAAIAKANAVNSQNKLINMNDINAYNRNMAAYGGQFNTGLTSFDSDSGTHEQNPFGGIPQGIGQNGQPNLVEEGETKWNDYIFSKRISIDKKKNKSIIKDLGLPINLLGKDYAAASKLLSKESEERELDPISKRGRDDALSKLAMLQEMNRQMEMTSQYKKGGKLRKGNLYPGDNPGGQRMSHAKAWDYRDAGVSEENNLTRYSAISRRQQAHDNMRLLGFDPEIYIPGKAAFGYSVNFPDFPKDLWQERKDMTDTLLNNNPEMGGVLDFLHLLRPGQRREDLMDDLAYGNPFGTSEAQREWDRMQTVRSNSPFGPNPLYTEVSDELAAENLAATATLATKARTSSGGSRVATPASIKRDTTMAGLSKIGSLPIDPSTLQSKTPGGTAGIRQTMDAEIQRRQARAAATTTKGNQNNHLLRYAPALANLGQLASLVGRKPEVQQAYTVSPQMVTDRMNYNPIDSNYLVNQMQQQGAATSRYLQNNAGGNAALANTLLLAQNKGNQSAVANALMQAQQLNDQKRNQAINFNANIAARNAAADLQAQQFNAQSRMQTDIINQQEKDALETQRRNLIAQLGQDLGGIGTEDYWRDIAPTIYNNYRYDGTRQKKKGGKLNKRK